MTGWIYNWDKKHWCNTLVIWLDKYILRSGSDLWLDVNNLQLYRIIGLKYVKEITNIRYKIKNYLITRPNERPKINLWKIRRYLIIGLEEYNI